LSYSLLEGNAKFTTSLTGSSLPPNGVYHIYISGTSTYNRGYIVPSYTGTRSAVVEDATAGGYSSGAERAQGVVSSLFNFF